MKVMAPSLSDSFIEPTNKRDFSNILANSTGQIISILSSFIFLPIIIGAVGIEKYGLIAFFTMLFLVSNMLDFGLTPALTREISRRFRTRSELVFLKEYIHAAEMVLFFAASAIIAGFYFSSNWITVSWLSIDNLSVVEVKKCISVMGIVIALRLYESAYRGVLIGFHNQVILNVITSMGAILRWGGAAALLYLFDSSIFLFFVWQASISCLVTLALVIAIYFPLRSVKGNVFWSSDAFKVLWSFSGPMAVQALFIVLATQMDKLILSKLLSLEDYGYYSIAAIFTSALIQIAAPISQTYFANLSESIGRNDIKKSKDYLDLSTQLAFSFVGPIALILCFFSYEVLLIWSSQAQLAAEVAPILSLLSLSALLAVITNPLYNLGLANGNVSIFLLINLIAMLWFIPAMIFLVPSYGMIGAAFILTMLNLFYFLIEIYIVFRIHPDYSRTNWLQGNLLLQLFTCITIALTFFLLKPEIDSLMATLIYIGICFLLMLGAVISVSSKIRSIIINYLSARRFKKLDNSCL
ncbi:oligosaccharide flippase family protein [Porticoccaceae bacterium]|nr:oligosaccharide flippase family protein [Porticoccaceae bacterium]